MAWGPPVTIAMGLVDPTPGEVLAVRHGRIEHRLGGNEATTWISLSVSEALIGEVFFSAGVQPDDFTPLRLFHLHNDLVESQGLICHTLLVNSRDQRIAVNRFYSWSNQFSYTFLEAVERTRSADAAQIARATDALLRLPTPQLAAQATLGSFILPARDRDVSRDKAD